MQGGFWAYITVVDPSQIGGIDGPRPDQGLPGRPPGRPDQGLPGHQPGIDNTLPGQQPHPDHGLPPFPGQGLPGQPVYPDQGLPGQQPRPGQGLPPFPSHPIAPGGGQLPTIPGGPANQPSHGRWEWHPIYGWIWVPGNPSEGGPRPDQGLPGNQPHPDQGLPDHQPHPDQGLPPSQARPDNTLPQTPQPKPAQARHPQTTGPRPGVRK